MDEKKQALDPEAIRSLVKLVEENNLAELTVEGEEYEVTVKAEGVVQGVTVAAAPAAGAAAAASGEIPEEGHLRLRAPMTGTYYRAQSPGDPPFIEVGDRIEVGQVIGLIEAMKVFSEVPSEAAGRVVAIPAKNGDLVHQDQVLVILAEEADAG